MRATLLMGLWVPLAMVALLSPGASLLAALSQRRSRTWPATASFATVGPAVLVASAAVHLMAFFAWWVAPWLGRTWTVVVLAASWVNLARPAIRRRVRTWIAAPQVGFAAGLAGGAALVVLGSLLLHGGALHPTDVATQRWTADRLPPDNVLPAMLADRVIHGAPTDPFFAGWQSSDRPPLEAGAVAFTEPLRIGLTFEQHYQVVCTALAALCLPALYALLLGLRIRTSVAVAAVIGAASSGTLVLNAGYVWPKLLSAALVLCAGALLLPGADGPPDVRRWAMAGMACSLSLLAHGAGLYAILPVVVLAPLGVLAVRPGATWWKRVGVGIIVSALTMLPWLLYQRFVAPPGDRLLTWHLAGVEGVVADPWYRVMVDHYRSIGWAGAWHNHWANVGVLANHDHLLWRLLRDAFPLHGPSTTLRSIEFGHFLNTVGAGWLALLASPVAVLQVRRRVGRRPSADATHTDRTTGSTELDAGAVLLGWVAWAVLVWCAVAFGPAATIPHQGTAVTSLLLMAAPIVVAGAIHPRVAWAFAALAVARVSWVWLLAADPARREVSSAAVMVLIVGALMISAPTIVLLAGRSVSGRRRPDAPSGQS